MSNYLVAKEIGKDVSLGCTNAVKAVATFPSYLRTAKIDETKFLDEVKLPLSVVLGPILSFGVSLMGINSYRNNFMEFSDFHTSPLAITSYVLLGTNIASGLYEWVKHKSEEIRNRSRENLLESKITEEERLIGVLRKEGHSNEIIYDTLKDLGHDEKSVKRQLKKQKIPPSGCP